jgi:hypothetical protein
MASVTLKAFNYYPSSWPATTTTFTYVYTGHAAYPHLWVVDRVKIASYDQQDIGEVACAAAKCTTRFFFTESNDINSSVKTLSDEMKETLEAYNAVHPSPNNISFDARLIYYTLFKSLDEPVFNSDNTWYVPLKDYTPDYASSILTPIYVTNLSKAEILEKLQGATTESKLVVYRAVNTFGTAMPLFECTYQEVTKKYMLFHVDNFEYFFMPGYEDNDIDAWPLSLTSTEYSTLLSYASKAGQEIDFDNWSNYLDKENANDNGDYLLVRIDTDDGDTSIVSAGNNGWRIWNQYWSDYMSLNALIPASNTTTITTSATTSAPVQLVNNMQVKILYNTYSLLAGSSIKPYEALIQLVNNSGTKAYPYEASVLWGCFLNAEGTYTHVLEFNYGTTATSYTTTIFRLHDGSTSGDETHDTTVISEGDMVIALPMEYYNKTGEHDQYELSTEDVDDIINSYNNNEHAISVVYDTSDSVTVNSNNIIKTANVVSCLITSTKNQTSHPLFRYSTMSGCKYNQFFHGYGNDCINDAEEYPNAFSKFYNNKGHSYALTVFSPYNDSKTHPRTSIPTDISSLANLNAGFCKIIFTSSSNAQPTKLLININQYS